jgi:Trypsin
VIGPTKRHRWGCLVTMVAAVWSAGAPPARAIFWNNDPAHGVTSTTGLTDRVDWFQNVHTINNTSNNTFGTTTLLDSEWAISVRHVVQNGGNYGQITAPSNVYVNVFGTRYYADQIYTPDGGSEISLLHLRGGVNGALNVRSQVNSGFDETGRLVHIGGYGYSGYFGAGATLGLGSFHRAYNVPYVAGNGQLRIIADGETALAANGLLEGTVGSGDSGGPMWAYYGRGFNVENATMDQWRLVGLTATGSGGSGGEAWGGSSNYTRVANYATWINNTLNSVPPPKPSTTGAWMQDSGSGLYDTGGAKFSVTGSNAAPAVHANFGPNGEGFTLDSVGDQLTMTAIVDTTLPLANIQLRYGMFDDDDGVIPGDVAGGTPWRGYFAGNATEGAAQGVYEKGPNGGGVGQWWSFVNPNSAPVVGRSTLATGTYDDAAGTQSTPAGRYEVSLAYTRLADGLSIDWSTAQVDAANLPTGVYSHGGSIFDATPASDDWTYNQLGFFLYGGAYTGTTIVDDVQVAFFSNAVPEPSCVMFVVIAALSASRIRIRRVARQ